MVQSTANASTHTRVCTVTLTSKLCIFECGAFQINILILLVFFDRRGHICRQNLGLFTHK